MPEITQQFAKAIQTAMDNCECNCGGYDGAGTCKQPCDKCDRLQRLLNKATIKTDPDSVIRWTVTHIARDGFRIMTAPARQGRYTYETEQEAQTWLDAMLVNTPRDTLIQIHGAQAMGTFRTDPCSCWPGHFDPKQMYFF
jgi:hypothetical protein